MTGTPDGSRTDIRQSTSDILNVQLAAFVHLSRYSQLLKLSQRHISNTLVITVASNRHSEKKLDHFLFCLLFLFFGKKIFLFRKTKRHDFSFPKNQK